MTISTPNFHINAPSPATKFKDLGAELQQFGLDVDSTLKSFDYNGADPNLVVSRVSALEAHVTNRRAGQLIGTSTERELFTEAQYGVIWQDTDAPRGTWMSDGVGGWRHYSGTVVVPGGAWSGSAPVYVRTVTVTIPTVLSPSETIMLGVVQVGSGYGTASVAATVRNVDDTELVLRHIQFNSATQNGITLAWFIIPGT